MDRIVLEGIEVWAHHGVLGHETQVGQAFRVDVTIELDLGPAAADDELALTVDYGELAKRIREAVALPPANLIETVAERVAHLCLEDPLVQAVEVVLHKPAAPVGVPVRDIRVELRRER